MIWVFFYEYNTEKFMKKINSLPRETVENAKIFHYHGAPRGIMYWEEKETVNQI